MQVYAERKHGSKQMSEPVWPLHGDVTLQRHKCYGYLAALLAVKPAPLSQASKSQCPARCAHK
jgi:hypothetical protein